MSEFKYFGCVLDESGTDGAEFCRNVASGRKVVGAARSLVNARSLKPGYGRMLHEVGNQRSCPFYYMTVIQWYRLKRKSLGIGLYR